MRTSDIKPTRSELLAVKRRIQLSERAHTLLKRKQDGLMRELEQGILEMKQVQSAFFAQYTLSQHLIAVASMMEGMVGVAIAAESIEQMPSFEQTQTNILGVWVPVFHEVGVKKNLDKRGYCVLGTDSVIDDVAGAFEDLLSVLIQAAACQTRLHRILTEFVRTRRRVRALEYRLIPDLIRERDYIQLRQDELDREEASRLFHIKKGRIDRDR